MSPCAPARPSLPEVPLKRSQRIPRPRFDPDNAYGQRQPVENKRSLTEHIKEDDLFLIVNEIRAQEMNAHFMKALLSIDAPVKTSFTPEVTPRKSRVEGGWDLASPYVVHPCLHTQWSCISGLVEGGDKDLSRCVNKPVKVGLSRLSE